MPYSMASSSTQSPPSSPIISWPLHRPQHRTPWDSASSTANGHAHTAVPAPAYPPSASSIDPLILPDGRYPLSGISLRAFTLGLTLGLSTSLSSYLALTSSPLWRAPFFLASLSLFHFLEYYTTAAYNAPRAAPSAFLLSLNGSAYNIAHAMAFLETTLAHGPSRWGFPLLSWLPRRLVHEALAPWTLGLGMVLMLLGQVTRSVAMAQAGTNFNHTVQQQRAHGHELVTKGVYGILRHPSYFGFWWWGIGGQMVLGNVVCLFGYAVVLWRFFRGRIHSR